MLYHFFEWLNENFAWAGWARLFDYITFRAGLAILISLTISMIFGGSIINFLRKQQVGETIRDLGLKGQKEKEGTPTMGGIIIVLAIVIPSILLNNLTNVYIQLMLFATIWLAGIGFMDDYIKVFKKDKSGLQGKFKILGQIVLGGVIGSVMIFNNDVMVRMDDEIAWDKGYENITIIDVPIDENDPNDESYYPYMNGQFVFKNAVVRFSQVIMEGLQANNLEVTDIDMLVPHQANLRISQFIQKKFGLENHQVFNNIMKYGNTTAASIPIALTEAWEQKKINKDDVVVLAAFGSGFTWGSVIIKW